MGPGHPLYKDIPMSTPNLLDESLPLPAAVIYQSRLDNNLHWMQRFAEHNQVQLCPHGKTTMTPDFFRRQIDAGAWGLTLATVPQVKAAADAGVPRILMANQLVGRANMDIVSDLLAQGLQYYCLVDNPDNIRALNRFFGERGQTLPVLLEVGVPGGRCGCRTRHQIDTVLAALKDAPALQLSGVETYEGVIHGSDPEAAIRAHLQSVRALTLELHQSGQFAVETPILTGAGSAWYDVVMEEFGPVRDQGLLPVLRPGCYLIHDKGIYWEAQSDIMTRLPRDCQPGGNLQSSLEVWAYVQSIPEPGMAILTIGKREVAFDAGLPQPVLHYRPTDSTESGSAQPQPAPNDWEVDHIMDHHSRLRTRPDADLQVGDIIALSTSHPCLTFDKWRQLLVINDHYQLLRRVDTHF